MDQGKISRHRSRFRNSTPYSRSNPGKTSQSAKTTSDSGRISLAEQQRSTQIKKENIQQQFQGGGLCCRGVKSDEERVYLNAPRPAPRPVFVIKEGVFTISEYIQHPIYQTTIEDGNLKVLPWRSPENHGSAQKKCEKFTLVITEEDMISCYKRNATTATLQVHPDTHPSELKTPCLADKSCASSKITEMSEQDIWEVYKPMTSGKLLPNGTFKHPGVKPSGNKRVACNNEYLTTGYSRNNISALLVSRDLMARSLVSCLHGHQRGCQLLTLDKPLLVIYDTDAQSLEVYCPDEICPPERKQQLFRNEYHLQQAMIASGVELEPYHQIMAGLPLRQRVDAICSLPWSDDDYRQLNQPFARELWNLVTTPAEFNAQTFQNYCRQGARPSTFYLYNGEKTSLIEALLDTEIHRCSNQTTCSSESHTSICRNTTEQAHQLLKAMLKAGCPRHSISLTDATFFLTPMYDTLLAADMIKMEESLFYLPIADLDSLTGNEDGYPQLCEDIAKRAIEKAGGDQQKALFNVLEHIVPYEEIQGIELLHALFRKGAKIKPLQKQLLAYIKSDCIPDDCDDPDDYAEAIVASLQQVWNEWHKNPRTKEWQQRLRKGQDNIQRYRESLPAPLEQTTDRTQVQRFFGFLEQAYNQPPEFPGPIQDNDQTALAILNHYYRRPGHQQVVASLTAGQVTAKEPSHGCSHALRVRNNINWYRELLEQQGYASFTSEEKQLLALAGLYLSSAVDMVEPAQTAAVAADYFRRDMAAVADQTLVEQIARAIQHKDDSAAYTDKDGRTHRIRLFMHILRLGERADRVNGSRLGVDFPLTETASTPEHYAFSQLDIPEELVLDQDFMVGLIAALHGATDLACATGGAPAADNRIGRSYQQRHNLVLNDSSIQKAFEQTPQPLSRTDYIRDNNVRRTIARKADLSVCNTKRPRCRPDLKAGKCFGIHNSHHDLQQVRIPECMTTLEKMQIEYHWSLLSLNTQAALRKEVARLKIQGIEMNLGTLTQETLQSWAARPKLRARGLRVERTQKTRGYDKQGREILVTMYRPVSTAATAALPPRSQTQTNQPLQMRSLLQVRAETVQEPSLPEQAMQIEEQPVQIEEQPAQIEEQPVQIEEQPALVEVPPAQVRRRSSQPRRLLEREPQQASSSFSFNFSPGTETSMPERVAHSGREQRKAEAAPYSSSLLKPFYSGYNAIGAALGALRSWRSGAAS